MKSAPKKPRAAMIAVTIPAMRMMTAPDRMVLPVTKAKLWLLTSR